MSCSPLTGPHGTLSATENTATTATAAAASLHEFLPSTAATRRTNDGPRRTNDRPRPTDGNAVINESTSSPAAAGGRARDKPVPILREDPQCNVMSYS